MHWAIILAIVLAATILLVPVVFIWYLNLGGIYASMKEARKRKAALEKEKIGVVAEKH